MSEPSRGRAFAALLCCTLVAIFSVAAPPPGAPRGAAGAGADSLISAAAQARAERILSGLIFSHDRHAEREDGCDYCHREDEGGPAAPRTLGMDECFRCHEGRRGVQDCAICHSDTRVLPPADHELDWPEGHGVQARVDEQACVSCHNRDHCQECHESAVPLAATSGAGELFLPYGPQVAAEGLGVERAHEIDYRYTHPLDAAGKESDCFTCHRYESFCTECHAPEDDPEKFRPLWHGGPGWGAVAGAVGSGGGRHAEMARRDMELCAACHEVGIGGADPRCLECHRDALPGRGNDPSTHEVGFAGASGEGRWHNDPGAVCYICHVRSQAGDAGFCGYCHGPWD